MKAYDVIIIGAGAAGIFACITAGNRGRRVAVLDMGAVPLRKVALSGGGRCNFTNLAASRDRYYGENPDFVRSAIAQFSPYDMLAWAGEHNISWIEKESDQYFCADGANAITDALMHDARKGADIHMNQNVIQVDKSEGNFVVKTQRDTFIAKSVIVATGGVSFPVVTVSDIGYKIAKQFGHKIIPVRPALCAIKSDLFSSDLAGISMPAEITIGHDIIRDSILFTHTGIGGPATYRATVRDISNGVHINLMPGADAYELLRSAKQTSGRASLCSVLAKNMPNRVAKWISGDAQKNIADYRDSDLANIAHKISDIFIGARQIKLNSLQSAEVMRGGVSTDKISSKTMQSKLCDGLFFAGEVLDIAGDLGGFNLHWAWASGYVAGKNA